MFDVVFLKIPLITVVASFIVVVPIIFGTATIKFWWQTPLKVVFYYCCVYSLFEGVAWYYVLNHWQNHFLVNTIAYVDTLFLGYFFYSILSNPIHKTIVVVLIVFTIIMVLWSNLEADKSYNRIDSFAQSISNISLIAMSLLFFYQLLNNLDVKNLFLYPYFWVSVAILVYFSGVFFVNIFGEYITFNKDKSITQFWNTKDYLLLFQRILLAIGLWFSKTPQQLSPSSK